jgi:hypothetical protein
MAQRVEDFIEEASENASDSSSVKDILKNFNYGTSKDDKLIFNATCNRLWSQDYAADAFELSGKYFGDNE